MKKHELFLELAKPDNDGFSRKVAVTEFRGRYASLLFGNGGDWARTDGSLGKRYNVVRHKEYGNAISHVELQGYNKQPKERPIGKPVRDALAGQRCVVLATRSKVQVDHKDGRYDNRTVSNVAQQTVADFQPLSQAVNYAKRQHCKRCKETGERFDAKLLGYTVSQIKGNGKYRGTCVGCYWYDPKAFNASLHLGD